MRQLLVPRALRPGQRLDLTGSDYHYLSVVLRLRAGDTVPALDAEGSRWDLQLLENDGSKLVALVEAGAKAGALVFPRLTLYQAIPKGSRFDDLVRQLVQFGIDRICPVFTERTVSRPDREGTRVDRWRRVAREAVQQSGANRPVGVEPPQELAEIRPTDGALALVLHAERCPLDLPGDYPLAQSTLHGYLGEVPDDIDLVVGPEGGFTDAELIGLFGKGFRPLWLGPQVLRSESAALFAAAAVRILVLERDHWQPRGEHR